MFHFEHIHSLLLLYRYGGLIFIVNIRYRLHRPFRVFLNGIFFYLPEFGFVLYVSGFRSCVLCFRSCVCVFVCLLQPGSQLLVCLQTQSSRQTFVFCTTLCAPERKNSQKLIFITKVANIWLTLFI